MIQHSYFETDNDCSKYHLNVRDIRYLNDRLRGLIEGDLLPSSSIKLGFDSFDEKWR